MAKSGVYRRSQAKIAFNMTPMIDCVFQLIIFFMLTTQMASADFVQMKLPEPDSPQVKDYEETNKVIVNVVPYPDGMIREDESLKGLTKEYRLGTLVIKRTRDGNDTTRVVRELEKARGRSRNPKEFVVELRADKRVYYNEIEPVLRALQQAKLGKMHITAMQ